MPEAAEIKIAQDFIKKNFLNKKLIKYNFNSGKHSKRSPKLFNKFNNNLPLKLIDVHRIGKLMIFKYSKDGTNIDWWVCNFFGLQGIYRTELNGEKKIIVPNFDIENKSVHVTIEFSKNSNSPYNKLYFMDASGFGSFFYFINNEEDYNKLISKLAIDIYDNNLSLKIFKKKINEIKNKNLKRNEICVILLNQHYLVSGLGNYLKCEILYDAKLSPFRTIESLTNKDISVLYHSIIKVANQNLKAGGKMNNKILVYNRKIDPKGNTIKYEKTPDNKYTYWVPNIQK
jgi:formamidopyrimidine-DNA glycosylase